MLYQGSVSFPCCLLLRQIKHYVCSISFGLGWHIPIWTSAVYQVFDIPGHISTVTSHSFWRHASVSEASVIPALQANCLWLWCYLICSDCLDNSNTLLHVGGSSPLACAQLYKMIDMTTCFLWFVLRFLSGASLTTVNNCLDCIQCLSLIHFFFSDWRISYFG